MEKWEKCALRTAKKQMRKAIDPEQRTLWEQRIIHNIVESSAYQDAQILMSYCAMGGEVDLQFLHQMRMNRGNGWPFPIAPAAPK